MPAKGKPSYGRDKDSGRNLVSTCASERTSERVLVFAVKPLLAAVDKLASFLPSFLFPLRDVRVFPSAPSPKGKQHLAERARVAATNVLPMGIVKQGSGV